MTKSRAVQEVQSRALLSAYRYGLGKSFPGVVTAMLGEQQTSCQSLKLGERKYLAVFPRRVEARGQGLFGKSDLARSQAASARNADQVGT